MKSYRKNLLKNEEQLQNLRAHVAFPELRNRIHKQEQEVFMHLPKSSSALAFKIMSELKVAPKQARGDNLRLWKSIRRNSFEMILSQWRLVEPTAPLIDAQA